MMNNKNNMASTTMEPAGRRGEPVDVYDASGSKPLATPSKRTNTSNTTTPTPTTTPTSSHVDEMMEWLEHKTKLGSSDLEQGRRLRGKDNNNNDDDDDDGALLLDDDIEAQDDDEYDDFDSQAKPGLATPQFIYRSSDDASSLSTLSTRRSAEPPGLYHGGGGATAMMQHAQQPRPMMLTDMSTSEAVAILVRGPSTGDDDADDENADSGTTTPVTIKTSKRGSLGSRDASGKILHTNHNIPTAAIDNDDDDDDVEIAEPMEDTPPAAKPPADPDPEGGAYSESSDTSCHDEAAVEEDDDDEEKFIKAILDCSPETTAAAAAASNRPQQQQQRQPGAYRVPGRRPVVDASSSTQQQRSSFAHVAAAAPVTAVLVSSSDDEHIMAELVQEEDSTTRRNNNNKNGAGANDPSHWSSNSRIRIVGIVLLIVLCIVVIGLVVAVVGNKKPSPAAIATPAPTPTPPPIDPNDLWYQVMDPIDGSRASEFGSSVSMCSDGSRVAIGAQGSGEVQVYELKNETEGGRKQIGQTILQNNVTGTMSVPFIRSQVVVELARNCDILAIGYPFANVGDKQMAGQVEMYEYDSSLDSWIPLGDPHIIPGEEAGDFAGASISLSQTGDRVAIGSPGNDWAGEDAGRARVFLVNRGGWELLGTAINGTFPGEEFGGSISLTSDDSADTYILAVGSSTLRTTPSDEYVFTLSAEVARVYEFQTGTWSQRGQGIVPDVLGIDTAWFVKLSSDGKKLAVSNLYLDPDGVRITDGEVNSGIYVAAFEIDMMMTNWFPRGGNIHANFPGKKSGYIISLSDDGSRIGMGDPGRAEAGGLAGHSHFYEFIDGQWCQLGPNIHGESAGDMAGYSVSMSGDGKRMVVASPRSRAQGLEHGRVIVVELHEELIVPQCEGISF